MIRFRELSLGRQFLLASLPVMLLATLAIGWWVTREIERGVASRLGEVTSLYVDSLAAPHLRELLDNDALDDRHRAALDALLTDTALGQRTVAFNIWRPDGTIVYSTADELVDRSFPTGEGFANALAGKVHTHIIERAGREHGFPDARWPPRLIETYAPVHEGLVGKVIGVAELYQTTEALDRETAAASRRSWLVVIACMAATYLVLFGLVRGAGRTIEAQRRELGDRVTQLSDLLARNAQLDARVRDAAARTAALNERFLRRISADLHDGPGQDLGFALMRLEAMDSDQEARQPASTSPPASKEDIAAVRASLRSALSDLRSISAGLQLPELEDLSLADVAARAVRDYERKSGGSVGLEVRDDGGIVALPTKITLYRLLQEALANGMRHAGGADQRVRLARSGDEVIVEVSDAGPGVETGRRPAGDELGLAGMRERVRALGGSFELRSAPGRGTSIRVALPASVPEVPDD